jgi:DNA-binding beta-propeller fold protein YncE
VISFTRRALLSSFAMLPLACQRQRGSGYPGYAFVANYDGNAVAAVDLTAFAVAKHIRLPHAPTALAVSPKRRVVYALTPSSGTVHEIDTETLAVRRSVRVADTANAMHLHPEQDSLCVLSASAQAIARVDVDQFRAAARVEVGPGASDFAVSADGGHAAVAYRDLGSVAILKIDQKRKAVPSRVAEQVGAVRFRSDGRSVLVADTGSRMLTILETESAEVVTRLPLAVRPDHLCFHLDGGQLFITGEGRDVVVIVYPYHVPEVAKTVLAGGEPRAMAASRQYLFVANPGAGDVSILDIRRHRMVAPVAVGAEPGHIVVTPDDEYALILNEKSGDMGVIWLKHIVSDERIKRAALFTMIPIGSRPVSAVVTPALS